MKSIACKTVVREIDELELGQQPSVAVKEHTNGCISCQTFYDDRHKLRELIAGLETVNAPADFDFRLRARLAHERSTSASSSTTIFGFGLPAIALAIIAVVAGVTLFMRAQTFPRVEPAVVQNSTPATAEQNSSGAVTKPAETTAKAVLDETAITNAGQASLVKTANANGANKNSRRRMKRAEALLGTETAAMFPLEAAEPLRVSVDYKRGGSRTISVPAVSFGSQQVVSSNASLVKTSARTVW